MSAFSSILGDAKTAVRSGGQNISAAAQAAASGDLTAARDILANTPSDLISGIGSGGGVDYGDYGNAINARSDAIQNWCWYCILPSLSNRTATAAFGMQPAVSLPWYYVEKANLPGRTFQLDSIARNGHKAHYAESYSVSDLSLEFFLDSSNKSYQYLKAWQGLILGNNDPSSVVNQGRWGLPADYKKNISLFVLSVDKKVLLNMKYINCWPVDPQALELTSGNAEAMHLSVSFAVEDVNVTVQNDKGLIENLINTAAGYSISAIQDYARKAL